MENEIGETSGLNFESNDDEIYQLEPQNSDTSLSNTKIIVMQDDKPIYFGIVDILNLITWNHVIN